MKFSVSLDAIGNTPLYGDSYVRRPAISGASTKRQSAPPRPPRPELNPWPKQIFETSIAEVSAEEDQIDNVHGRPYSVDDGCLGLTRQDFAKQENPGRISPVSEEDISSAGTDSNNVSPSNSMNKKFDERPALRPRPFSFESLRSAASCYSQDSKMKSRAGSRGPQTNEFEDYADIAMSNPFTFQREIEEMRPYASHTYIAEAEEEPDETRVYTHSIHTSSAISLSRSRPQSVVVPMSRYNSRESSHSQHRKSQPPPPAARTDSPDIEVPDPEKTLAEAWEDVKKAVAPKLRVARQDDSDDRGQGEDESGNDGLAMTRATSMRTTVSTEHALPEAPAPPPVPTRDPRRRQGAVTAGADCHVSVSRQNTGTVASQPARHGDRQRLSQSTSSPNMSKTFYKQQPDVGDAPPMPALPSQAELLAKTHTPVPLSPTARSHASNAINNLQRVALTFPAPLPSPAASASSSTSTEPALSSDYCTTRSDAYAHAHAHALHSPTSLTTSRSSQRFSYDPSRASYLSYAPQPLSTTPPLSLSSSSRQSMGQASSVASDQPSPRSRGFHEPPPVAPTPMRFNTVAAPRRSAHLSLHKSTKSDGDFASGPESLGIWTGGKAVGATFTTQIWAQPERSQTINSIGATLRSILPGESATTKPTAPSRSATQASSSATTSSRSGSSATTVPSPKRIDEFPSLRTIPLASNFNATSADDYLPKFSNSFAGFCKSAWRAQTAQSGKAFTLRTVTMTSQLPNSTTTTTKVTTLKCKKCAFEGPLSAHPSSLAAKSSSYAASSDLSRCADQTPHTAHGVVYRWSFLFKSHVPTPKAALPKDQAMDPHAGTTVYACLFCCADGKGTVCFEGAKNLCGHISKCHPRGVIGGGERELRMRVGIVVGRRPDKHEAWDIILPGNRKRDDREVQNWL